MSEEALRRIAKEKKARTGFLYLSDCDLTEIPKEISDLLWLKKLYINGNRYLASLDQLQNLSQLQTLFCYDTQIADLTPLQNLSQLQTLHCAQTHINDLTPLQNLSQLQTLFCAQTHINDLTPLQNLSQLQALFCYDTQIADLTHLFIHKLPS